MSTRALVLALAVLVVLAGFTIVLMRPAGRSSPKSTAQEPSFLIDFDPTMIVRIGLSRAGSSTVTCERTERGGWIFRDASGLSWPAAIPGIARQALGALAAIPSADSAAEARVDDTEATVLTLGTSDGTEHRLFIGAAAVGGRRLVRAAHEDTPAAVVDGRILAPLIEPGPSAWRVPVPLTGVRDATRITLTTHDVQIRLARLEGRWLLREPVGARADPRAVANLQNALAALRVEEFIDDGRPDTSAADLNQPRLAVTLETDRRVLQPSGELRVRTHRQTLRIGGPANISGDVLFAARGDDEPVTCTLRAQDVSAISTAARNYIEPTVTSIVPADVFGVILRSALTNRVRTYRRDGDRWAEVTGEGSEQVVARGAIEDLLELLSSRPGEPDPSPDPSDLRVAGHVDLLDLGGDPLDLITVGYTADDELAFRSRDVLVLFDPEIAPAILDLPAADQIPELGDN